MRRQRASAAACQGARAALACQQALKAALARTACGAPGRRAFLTPRTLSERFLRSLTCLRDLVTRVARPPCGAQSQRA
jgi:hypothetical protein